MNTENIPVMMYIHGFLSGANGSKKQQLQNHFKNRYRVIAPEVDADPDKSLAKLNEIIAKEKPEIIIGTSLGGWMTMACDSCDAKLVVVNPCTQPAETLAQWKDQELDYFCPRLDGVQTYTLTQEVLDKYDKYDIEKEIKAKTGRLYALCSTADELIGDQHIKTLQPLLPTERLMIVDDFGHQCRDKGMAHLYALIENVLTLQRKLKTK